MSIISLPLTFQLKSSYDALKVNRFRKIIKRALAAEPDLEALVTSIEVGKTSQVFLNAQDRAVAGGKARAASMTAERRREIAEKAALARWGDKK